MLADGAEVTTTSGDRGMVFQDNALLPWRTVRSNIELALRLRGVPRAGRRTEADRWIAELGLTGFGDYLPKSLSGGMRQRVQLARGLAGAPRAVMMDEPFGALDTQTRAAMQRLLIDTWRAHPTTVVFVTHDVDEALMLGDRIAVLGRAGRPLRALVDVPEPRVDRHAPRDCARKSLPHWIISVAAADANSRCPHAGRLDCDVLVIGGGTAGTMAALTAAEHGAQVLLLEKAHVRHSGALAMGMDGVNNAVIPGKAEPEDYVAEITRANDGIVNQRTIYQTATPRVRDGAAAGALRGEVREGRARRVRGAPGTPLGLLRAAHARGQGRQEGAVPGAAADGRCGRRSGSRTG